MEPGRNRGALNMHVGLTMFPTDYAIPPHELAVAAEARGYESLWLPEHSHIPTSRKSPWPGGAELPKYYYDTYDPFLSLAAAAAVTKTIKLATGICSSSSAIPSTPPRRYRPSTSFRPAGLFLELAGRGGDG